GVGTPAYQELATDPSSDNFKYYRDPSFDKNNSGILSRYKNFNNPQGNSPIAKAGDAFASAFTLYPDGEDLNRDNTLNEAEEYFQYRIDLKPNSDPSMQVGQNFIADRKIVGVTLADGTRENQIWYQFRVPISNYTSKVGDIPDFKSIRFFRMFLTDFSDSVVLRFAKLELVRNNWRSFAYELDTTGLYKKIDQTNTSTKFFVSAVNIEENDRRDPIPYRTPPGIERVQTLSNGGINILQNEQALSINVVNLKEGDGRAVFKSFNHDLRQYKKLSMFYHAECLKGYSVVRDGELYAIIRLGNDYINNYYEIKYPLKITQFGTTDERIIWPEENELSIDLSALILLKNERNLNTNNPNAIYRKNINGKVYSIRGNPNLGEVKGILAGLENPADPAGGRAVNAEVWINELRLSGLDEDGGWAAVGQMNLQLADLGNVSMSANVHTIGFGQLEQRVNDRFRDDFTQFDISTNLQLGKLLPKQIGLEIPFFANLSQTISTPEYDPYDKDVTLKEKLSIFKDERDSIRNDAVDYVGLKTFNFTNVRFNQRANKKIRLWSISNFDFSYSFTETRQHNPLVENNQVSKTQGGIGYNYSSEAKYVEPFKKIIKSPTPWLDFIRNINFNPMPSLIGIRMDTRRQFGAFRPRNVGGGPFKIPETYDKYFVIDRNYNMRWDLTRSLNVDFKAINNSRVDEPFGRIDNKEKRDSLMKNFLKGGRNTIYNQSTDITYNFPTSNFPFLNWTTFNIAYRSTYNWVGASRLAINLGNTIQNSGQTGATAEFNFTQLYSKLKLFRAIDEINQADPATQSALKGLPKKQAKKKKGTAEQIEAKLSKEEEKLAKKEQKRLAKEERQQRTIVLNNAEKAILRVLTSLKRVGVSYNEGGNTFLPGYIDSTKFFGQNWKSMAPGLDFIMGKQPNQDWLNKVGKKGLITKDPILNNLFLQNYEQKLNITAQVEPIRDLIIDLNLDKSLTKNYSTLFKDTVGNGEFNALNPYSGGGFSISYISFQTLFGKFDPNNTSATFK
ncbi:MAG: cell surface protein SprA, partial [Bacteroidota bacterium]